jgi:hypothetical protein
MSESFSGIVTIAASPEGPPVISLNGGTGDVAIGTANRSGDLILLDGRGNPRVVINAQNGTLMIKDESGKDSVTLDARLGLLDLGGQGSEGDLRIRDGAGTFVFRFDANFAVLDIGGAGNEGDLRLHNDADAVTIHLDGGSGDIKLFGADLAEEFASCSPVEPGSVVVAIGPDEVAPSTTACDRRVVGVASGAGDFRSALRLGVRPGGERVPVAVVGRAYCKADAAHGSIALGDLLTTSPTMGHAMRVSDPAAAVGAIMGKALAPLGQGRGLIPLLLALR